MAFDLKYIVACVVVLVFCIAGIIIINLRNAKKPLVGVAEEEQEDFITHFISKKKSALARKPWIMSYNVYKLIATISAIIFAVLTFVLSRSFLFTVIAAALGTLVPEGIIMFQAQKQKSEFEDRYCTSLRQLVACLKSGMSIQQAVSDVCESPFVHDMIRKEYRQIDADIKLGITVQEAFQRFANRVDSEDAKDVAIAIAMQSDVGGREAETLESIAKNISSRMSLRKEITSMFAGSKMTVLSMDFVPFAIILFLYYFAPSYLEPFFKSTMMLVIFIALIVYMAIGSVVIHKIVDKMRKECGI